jgi:RNA polymerase sigma factor for flagellar operon FliA
MTRTVERFEISQPAKPLAARTTITADPAALEASDGKRERLILDHLPQVRLIARRIHQRLPDSVSLDDVISTGVVGLITAIDRFDPKHKVLLKTYAEYKIRGAILDSLRSLDWAPRQKRKMARQLEAAIHSVGQKLYREPTTEEVARELNLNLDQYYHWVADLRGLNIGALQSAGEDGRYLLDYIADDRELLPSRLMERSQLERVLAEAIDQMPAIDRTVISMHYREDLTLREIAGVIHLHESRVSQVKAQAILRLRASLARSWPIGGGR